LKKLISIAIALVMVLLIAVPALADVGTSVTILAGAGQGNPPDIVCSWVFPDDGPADGTQVMPPLKKDAYKDVWYFALVDDRQGDDDVVNVDVDVWHPACSPAPYNANNYFKYERTMPRWQCKRSSMKPYGGVFEECVASEWFGKAVAAKVFTAANIGINPNTTKPYTIGEITELIDQESVGFYAVRVFIHYEQPAGDYPVRIRAVDKVNNITDMNYTFNYIPVSMVEFDFTKLNFGSVMVNTTQEVDGDFVFADPAGIAGYDAATGLLYPSPAQATVRNIGNVWSKVTVWESNLSQNGAPLPKDPNWNVIYDACLSDPGADNPKSIFSPEETVTLARPLFLSETQKLDFSVKFMKYGQTGEWTGTMKLGSTMVGFPWKCD